MTTLARKLAERMSRGRVLRRHLPKSAGGAPLYVTPEARLAYWRYDFRKCDPVLFDLAAEFVKPGAVVWDVGANVGLFGFAAAHHAGKTGRVCLFEPDLWLAQLLRQSAAESPASSAPVDVIVTAVSDVDGVAKFTIANRRAANSIVGAESTQTGGIREEQRVPCLKVDTLLHDLPCPAVIKIDVECAEDRVLRGAETLLTKFKPILLVEISSANAAWDQEWLEKFGYEFYFADRTRSRCLDLKGGTDNIVAVPRGFKRPQ